MWPGTTWLLTGIVVALWITSQHLSQRRFGWDGKQTREGKKWAEGCREEREGRILAVLLYVFPSSTAGGSGTEQLNIQTAQWSGEHGAAVEHGCHHVQEGETLVNTFYLNWKGRVILATMFSESNLGSKRLVQWTKYLLGSEWNYVI